MSLTIDLPPELERQLRDQAAREGQPPEDLARTVLQAGLAGPGGIGGQASTGWFEPVARRISELARLPAGWDTYGARAPEPEAAAAALRILSGVMEPGTPIPQIVPTSRGGLSLEWHTRGISLEVDVFASGEYAAAFERISSGEEQEIDPTPDVAPLRELTAQLSAQTVASPSSDAG